MSVPAWPIPTHQTKLVISQPQLMVRFRFQDPIPTQMVHATLKTNRPSSITEMMNVMTQERDGAVSVGRQMSSVIWWYVL